MELMVSAAATGDEAEVVALWRACGLVAAHNDPGADFRFELAGACSTVLVGRDDGGRVRASAMVGHDGHRGWLYYVGCDPAVQRRGGGRRIVAAAEDWLRGRGVRKVQLLVRYTNTAVVPFYQRLGFAVEPQVVMSRWL